MAIIESLAQTIATTPFFVLETFTYALVGGVLPALLWLWFWMHEEHEHHESKGTISLVFVLGMVGVLVAFVIQRTFSVGFGLDYNQTSSLFIFSMVEEIIKFLCAFVIAFRTKVYDEPIDAFVYLMTAALGFAALESTLFLTQSLLRGDAVASIITGGQRFMGASLLHVVSSGCLSIFFAYAFYKSRFIKEILTLVGLMCAGLLHWLFNLLIIHTDQQSAFLPFAYVWMASIILIFALERVKKIKKF